LVFNEFELDGVPDLNNYCQDWLNYKDLNYYLRLAIGGGIFVMNYFELFILSWIVEREKKLTGTQHSISLLSKSTILPFVNQGLLLLVANMKFNFNLEGRFFEIIPLFKGEYPGFDSEWYSYVGETICVARSSGSCGY
jgi:hypothetical protein